MDSNAHMNGNMEDGNLEKNVPDVSFEGVKLSLDDNNPGIQGGGVSPVVDNAQFQPEIQHPSGFYFASQAGRLEAAASACQNTLINQEQDGSLLGVWLLTEIDHWDNEKERVAAVTEHSLYLVKFDFIVNQVKSYRRILYSTLSCIQKGKFSYPDKTFAQPRQGEGVRLHWSSGRQLSVMEKWNPFSDTIPYTTLASHPLERDNSRQTKNFQVGPFYNTLQQAVTTSRSERNPNLPPVNTTQAPIELEIYVGLSSMVYNQSKLGFFRERGGVSF